MDFKQLESFVAVVDEGSFSNAADRLQLSQSMVTIHIRNLEAELGTRLLNRTTRSMELSSDGQTYYYYAKQMLKLNRDSMFALTRADQNEKAINIVATPYTSRYYLANRIVEFKRIHPDVSFNITVCYNSEIPNKLHAGGFQFAFCNMKIMDSDYAVKHYKSSHLVIITPNEERFRALQGQPFPVELFDQEPLITRSSTSALQQEFLRWIKQNAPSVKLRIAAAIDDTETIKHLVANGLGISVISEVAVGEYLADGKLLSFPLEGNMPHHLYFVSKKKYLSPEQIEFRDFILNSEGEQE
ncbi:MAG: LysR family transcriptional regulator [Clostridia bacterium]|nr:LysR family transcriptional regulator [Clostridia bacterium]